MGPVNCMQLAKKSSYSGNKGRECDRECDKHKACYLGKRAHRGNKAFLADYGVSEGHVISRKELIFV